MPTKRPNIKLVLTLWSLVILIIFFFGRSQGSDKISPFEAKRCVVDLMNEGEFSKGICVGKEIEDQSGFFETDPRGGKFQFILWQDKISLVGLKPPDNFPIAQSSNKSPSIAKRRFLQVNFPEIERWKTEKIEKYENKNGLYINYTCLSDKSIFRLQITIWLKTNRIVAIKPLSIPNNNSSS